MNHRLKPGIGERVEKTLRWGNSRCNAFTAFLINEWPRSTPFNPGEEEEEEEGKEEEREEVIQRNKRRRKGKT